MPVTIFHYNADISNQNDPNHFVTMYKINQTVTDTKPISDGLGLIDDNNL